MNDDLTDRFEEIESLLAEGRAAEVLEALDGSLAAADAPYATLLQADALALQGKKAEAAERYLAALEQIVNDENAELDAEAQQADVDLLADAVRGYVEVTEAGQVDGRLMPLLDEATEVFPELAGLFVARGLAFSHAGKLENACDEFHYATSLDEEDSEAWEGLGDTAMAIGEFHLAMDAYDAAADLDPNSAELLYQLGQAAFADGNVVAASKAFEEGLGLAPGDLRLLVGHAVSAMATDDFDAAITDAEAVLAVEPESSKAFAILADATLQRDGAEAAIPVFDRWVAVEPESLEARLQRANALVSANQLAAARDDFAFAHGIAPEDERTVLGQALVLATSGDFEACDALARDYLASHPESDSAALLLAQTLGHRGDPAAAIEILDQAIEHNPDTALLYQSRAEMRYAMDQVTLAWRDVEWALDLDGEMAAALVLRATMMLEEGEPDPDTLSESLEDLDTAVELEPNLGPAYAWRGRAHSLKGDRRAAESDWRDAEAHLPADHPLLAAIRAWQQAAE